MADQKHIEVDDKEIVRLLVNEQVNTRLARIFTITWPIATIILGSFGVSQYFSISRMHEAQNKVDAIEVKLRDADENLAKVDSLRDKAMAEFSRFTGNLLNATTSISNNSLIITRLTTKTDSIKKIHEDALQSSRAIAAKSSQVSEILKEVEGIRDNLLETQSTISNLDTLSKQQEEIIYRILKLSASDFIWLREKTETDTINLVNIDDPQKPDYQLQIKLSDIAHKGATVYYRIKYSNHERWRPGGQNWEELGHIEDFPKSGAHLPQTLDIPETPYEVKAAFVNLTQGRDYAVLRIQPKWPK